MSDDLLINPPYLAIRIHFLSCLLGDPVPVDRQPPCMELVGAYSLLDLGEVVDITDTEELAVELSGCQVRDISTLLVKGNLS
jgi:hypothetical protein